MSVEVWIGLLLTLVGGVMAGNCMVPQKFVRHWRWENTWLVFSLVSLVLIPWLLAFLTIGDLPAVYAQLSGGQLAVPFLFGAGWGVAQVLFGLSMVRLGVALGYAIIIGLGAMLGSLVPLLFQHREVLASRKGLFILGGVVIMVAGIVVSSWAGRQRELAAAQKPREDEAGSSSYGLALLAAVICGVLAPMLNYSLAFGQEIAQEAMRQGASAANSAYAVWPVGLTGGLLPNLAYSLYLLGKNHSWGRFRRVRPDVYYAGLMGVLWMGAVAIYGMGAGFLGLLGTSIGWALFQIFMIMTANVSGLATGEWAGARRQTVHLLWAGLALLALATVVISMGNR